MKKTVQPNQSLIDGLECLEAVAVARIAARKIAQALTEGFHHDI